MGLFIGRRETLNEQLAREAGLIPQRERRRPVLGALTYLGSFVLRGRRISTWWARREHRELAKYTGERGYLSEEEATRSREELRLRAPDTPPPGFG